MITDDEADRLIAANPGVQGLAQLGRNAIERVAVLESENAYLRAANSDGAALLQSVCAERNALRARLAAIDSAPTVAIAVHVYTDRGPYKYLNFAEHDIPASGVELIARPAKEVM